MDDSYSKLQRDLKKPGLYKVKSKGRGVFDKELVKRITTDRDRVVTISDYYTDLDEAAENSARAAKEPRDSYTIDRHGFDMHFTPGIGKIGGLKPLASLNPARSRAIRESAFLLAETMAASRNVDGVCWVSQGGGSGVLTQALQILKKLKVNFEDTGHHVYFSGPSTNLVKAQNLVFDLNLKLERKAYSIGLLTNVSDTVKAPWHRRQRDPKNYSRIQMGVDMCKGTPQLLVGGAAIASSFGLGGLGGFIVGAGVAGFTALAAVTKSVAPGAHDKFKGKL